VKTQRQSCKAKLA